MSRLPWASVHQQVGNEMNKLLIVTGASRGIGKATVELFLRESWSVINIARTACGVAGVINFTIDLSDPNWQQENQNKIMEAVGQPEQICLVHNAAFYQKDRVDHLDPTTFRSLLEVNLVAPMALNSLFSPLMKAGSSIIYMGSTLSEKAVENNASYVISKHASVGMMRATTQDLSARQIHSCCVCPGFTETEMLVKHLNNDPALIEKLSERVGARRLIQSSEIASLIFYAANNPVLNGSVLHANLGQIES